MKLLRFRQIKSIIENHGSRYQAILDFQSVNISSTARMAEDFAIMYMELGFREDRCKCVYSNNTRSEPYHILVSLHQTMFRLNILYNTLMYALKNDVHDSASSATRSTIECFGKLAFLYYRLKDRYEGTATEKELVRILHNLFHESFSDAKESKGKLKDTDPVKKQLNQIKQMKDVVGKGTKYERENRSRILKDIDIYKDAQEEYSLRMWEDLSQQIHPNSDAVRSFISSFQGYYHGIMFEQQTSLEITRERFLMWIYINHFIWDCYSNIITLCRTYMGTDYILTTESFRPDAIQWFKISKQVNQYECNWKDLYRIKGRKLPEGFE